MSSTLSLVLIANVIVNIQKLVTTTMTRTEFKIALALSKIIYQQCIAIFNAPMQNTEVATKIKELLATLHRVNLQY